MLVSRYPNNGLAEKPVPCGTVLLLLHLQSIAWLPVANVTNVDFCFSISPPNFLLTDINRIRASGVIAFTWVIAFTAASPEDRCKHTNMCIGH